MFKTITRTEKYGNFEKKHIPKWGKKIPSRGSMYNDSWVYIYPKDEDFKVNFIKIHLEFLAVT